MPFIRSIYLSIIFLFFSITVSAQQYPATFLWRISGNGLTKPSYLYGTMHVQDRRLFFFGDSIYNAIEQSEGFSMEINPAEMMDSLFKSLDNEDNSGYLKNYLDSKEYKKIAKKLEKKLNMPADKITTKRLAKYKRELLAKNKRKDDMLTFMDMYLYNIAEKQGKITGGIEDVADQFQLVNELGVLDIDQYLKDDTTQLMNSLETMKQRYINRNLTGINDMVNGYTDSYKDILLIKRNAKMAIRMDSLAHIRNSFFAVGAAHLPGDSGVITLLRKKGFQVEPVMSTKYITPEDYKYTAKDLPWVKVEDENNIITVEMPGAPSPVKSNTVLPMKLYANLAESSCYGLAVTFLTQDEINPDTILSKIEDKYKETGLKILSKKKLTYKGMPGLELTVLQGEVNYFLYRVFLKGNKLILVLFGAPKKEQLNSPDVTRFFNSLEFNNTDSVAQKPWEEFRNEKNAFAIKFPSKAKYSSRAVPDATLAADQYMAVDVSDGSYYFLLIADTEHDIYVQDDSTYFESYKNKLNENTHNGVKEFTITTVEGFSACHYTAFEKEDGLDYALQGYLIRRGNRAYYPFVVTPKEKADFPQVTNFFRSFEILDYKKTNWNRVFLPDSSLSTMMPADLTVKDESNLYLQTITDSISDIAAGVSFDSNKINHPLEKNPITHSSFNKNTAVNYSIEVEKISPYYWAVDDTTYFKAKANSFRKYNDTIISYNYIKSIPAADVLIKFDGTQMYKKIRFMLNGDTTYTLSAVFPEELLTDAGTKQFFDNAAFTKKQPSTIFLNKSTKLFDALKSKDSATVQTAKDQLEKIDFVKKDLPYMLEGLLYTYRKNENEYRTINDIIAASIRPINDASVMDFIGKHYQPVNDSVKELPMLLLTLLAQNNTDTSYALLKKLLIDKKPLYGSAYKLGYAMEDSIQLTKSFFPEITTLYADSILGGNIAKLAVGLLDSNFIKPELVLLNEEGVIASALKQYKELKADIDNPYPDNNDAIVKLLGKFNSKKSNDLLLKYASLPQTWVINNAIPLLLKNNQTVPLISIKRLAADKEWRTDFYNSLKKINKTSFFPKEFYSQQKFAESYIYNELYDDESEINKIDYLTVKTGDVKGVPKRFVLCKVKIYENEGYHLAICGPFNKDQTIAEINETDKNIQIMNDEDFSASTIDEKFAKYLDELNK